MSLNKDNSSVKVAVIGGLFVLLAACVTGVFLLLNTLIEKDVIQIGPTSTPAQNISMPKSTSQPTYQAVVLQATEAQGASTTPESSSFLQIIDKTNNITRGFKLTSNNGASKGCPGAYLETGAAEIVYEMDIPASWAVIIDSWKADWEKNQFQNDGILIITGEWHGTVKINTGAICGVPADKAQTALEYRRSFTGNDGRIEYTLP